MTDSVPQPRIYRVWNIPGVTNADSRRFELIAHVLGGATASRLDRRLLHADKSVDQVSAGVRNNELGGIFFVQATVKQGGDVAAVEKAIDEELAKLIAQGPSADELARARTVYEAELVRGLERIGGFGGKADVLAACAVFTGKPNCFERHLETIATTTPAQLAALARGSYARGRSAGNRQPATVGCRTARSPAARRRERRRSLQGPADACVVSGARVPQARTRDAAERHEGHPRRAPRPPDRRDDPRHRGRWNGLGPSAPRGVGELRDGDARRRRRQLQRAGVGRQARVARRSARDVRRARLCRDHARDVDRDARAVARRPGRRRVAADDRCQGARARARDVDRRHSPRKVNPNAIATRVGPGLLFGAGHVYAAPASGTEASLAALTRDDVVASVKRSLRPERATLIVVGDVSMAELQPKLGAFSNTNDARGQRMWGAFAAVQIDKTIESIKEIEREIRDFATGKAPATAAELTKAQATETRTLPGSYETGAAVITTVRKLVAYARPDDYPAKRAAAVSAMTLDDVTKAAKQLGPTRSPG